MRKILLILNLTFFFILTFSCQRKKSSNQRLTEIYKEIRNSPHVNFPKEESDQKLIALEKLKTVNNEFTPDTLLTFFLQIDTTLGAHCHYQDKILEVLVDLNTPKSLKTFAKIVLNYKLQNCGRNFLDPYRFKKSANVRFLFPELAMALDKRSDKINDLQEDIIWFILRRHHMGDISKNDLLSSKPYLINYYKQLKIERDSAQGHRLDYPEVYYSHLPSLIECLSIYDEDSIINGIYLESLQDNFNFIDYYSQSDTICYPDYGYVYEHKLEILLQTILIFLNRDKPVDQKYIDKLMSDPIYRIVFYRELKQIRKEQKIKSKYSKQYYFAEADYIYSNEEYFNEPFPICRIKLVSSNQISEGANKGTYYFYLVSPWDNTFWLTYSGPQPLQQDKFVEHGESTGKYFYKISKDSVDIEVDKMVDKIKNNDMY